MPILLDYDVIYVPLRHPGFSVIQTLLCKHIKSENFLVEPPSGFDSFMPSNHKNKRAGPPTRYQKINPTSSCTFKITHGIEELQKVPCFGSLVVETFTSTKEEGGFDGHRPKLICVEAAVLNPQGEYVNVQGIKDIEPLRVRITVVCNLPDIDIFQIPTYVKCAAEFSFDKHGQRLMWRSQVVSIKVTVYGGNCGFNERCDWI